MSVITPANKLFRVIKGTTFFYRFQYLSGTPTSSAPINLTGYTATWAISWKLPTPGLTQLSIGQTAGHSGIFFGGDTNNLATGIIDLVISAADTEIIPWTTATHQFAITDPNGVILELFNGGIGVVGSFPQ